MRFELLAGTQPASRLPVGCCPPRLSRVGPRTSGRADKLTHYRTVKLTHLSPTPLREFRWTSGWAFPAMASTSSSSVALVVGQRAKISSRVITRGRRLAVAWGRRRKCGVLNSAVERSASSQRAVENHPACAERAAQPRSTSSIDAAKTPTPTRRTSTSPGRPNRPDPRRYRDAKDAWRRRPGAGVSHPQMQRHWPIDCRSWVKPGTPPLRGSCACRRVGSSGAAGSAVPYRTARHPRSPSTSWASSRPG